ncbi:16986_t:CDS:2 [Funneliformis geosporum]|nr:16986_t:CDS:2 [Funneliformis geosporum]
MFSISKISKNFNLKSLNLHRQNLQLSFQKRLLTSASNNCKSDDKANKPVAEKEIDEINKNDSVQESSSTKSKNQQNIDDILSLFTKLLSDFLVPSEEIYILHIHASYNNTLVTLTNSRGDILLTKSGGSVGFKKAQRGGYEAAHQTAAGVIQKIKEKGLNVKNVEICIKGFGPGRDAAFKALANVENQWNVKRITDTTPLPFNGCRPRKARRL